MIIVVGNYHQFNKFKVVYYDVNHLLWSSKLDWEINSNANQYNFKEMSQSSKGEWSKAEI